MYDEKEIEDSLEFCKDLDIYYKGMKDHPFYRTHPSGMEKPYKNDALLTEPKPEEGEPLWTHLLRRAWDLAVCILLAIVLANGIKTYIGQFTRVDGVSMEDSLHDKDYLIMDKLTYRFREPKRYDIIVFPFEKEVYYIKRIIGLPGETVQIAGRDILINGEVLTEDYGNEPIVSAGDAEERILLGQGEYFVLGDNRNHSMDSRFSEVGVIDRKHIVGKAWLRILPLSRLGFLKHQ